jgi:transposase
VTLVEEERQALQPLASAGKAAARELAHARVLPLSDEGPVGPGRTDEEIVEALNVSPSTIARVRKRFVTESVEAAIDHRPQPPRPEKVKLTDAVEKQLIELACSDPPQGRCCWTLQLLADRLVALGLVDCVSREAVRRALKKQRPAKRLKPRQFSIALLQLGQE